MPKAEKAKLFQNGGSQALRLPKSYRFDGDLVYLKQTPMGVLIISKPENFWKNWLNNLRQHTWDVDEITSNEPQERPWDELFT